MNPSLKIYLILSGNKIGLIYSVVNIKFLVPLIESIESTYVQVHVEKNGMLKYTQSCFV